MSDSDANNVFLELSQNQKAVAEALLAGAGKDEAAEAAGITRRTVDRYLNEPSFRAALEAATGDRIGDVSRRMVGAMDTAAGIMLALAEDEETPASVRLRACIAIVEHGPKLFEVHELVKRIEALEERMQ